LLTLNESSWSGMTASDAVDGSSTATRVPWMWAVVLASICALAALLLFRLFFGRGLLMARPDRAAAYLR
jgi:hypothetical protein